MINSAWKLLYTTNENGLETEKIKTLPRWHDSYHLYLRTPVSPSIHQSSNVGTCVKSLTVVTVCMLSSYTSLALSNSPLRI